MIPLDELGVVASATVRVPATCGELLQGVTPAGPVLVSLPVDLHGSVEVTLVRERVLSVTAATPRPKAIAALALALNRVAWPGGAVVRLGGEVPAGRGMGSSTVDVAGAIAGVAAAAGVHLQSGELLTLMTTLEPSDSSPLPGLWLVDHVRGRRAMHLGVAPDWTVVAVDSGTPVDTLALHAERGAGAPLPETLVERAMSAAQCGDAAALAAVATDSARRNQRRLAHPAFDVVRSVASRCAAPGICIAHSGSLCAVICHGDAQARATAAALTAQGLAPTIWRVGAPGLRVTRGSGDDRRGGASERGVLGDRRAAVPALLVRREVARRLPVRPR